MRMNIFRDCLKKQLSAHPAMQSCDVVKLCYQAACGAEHLLLDVEGAKHFFDEEYAAVPVTEEPLVEQISDSVCRVNLGAWKRIGMPSERLFRLFTGTVFQSDGKQRLREYLSAAEEVLRETEFDMDAWGEFICEYHKEGMPAVRHSVQYREQERPAYRIVGIGCLQMLDNWK